MKFALVWLFLFISVTWQQNVQWASPNYRMRFFPSYLGLNQQSIPIYESILASEPRHLPRYSNLLMDQLEARQVQRSLVGSYHKARTNGDQRAFGLGGINYLASLILYSLSLTATSTTYTTSTSTITGATVITCFTSSMFSDTVACRRKRDDANSNLLIGDDVDEYLSNAPNENVADSAFQLPREGRDINPAEVIASSQIEREFIVETDKKHSKSSVNRYVRQDADDTITLTSTVTTYSLYMQTSTRTVTNLASTTALSCLPSGFTLC